MDTGRGLRGGWGLQGGPSQSRGPKRAQTTQRVTRRPPHAARRAQLSCLANLAARQGLQGDFELHPPDLLLFYK